MSYLTDMMKKCRHFITDPEYRLKVLIKLGRYDNLSDEEFLTTLFPKYMGYPLNLENPITFSEKMQWMKVYDRNPLYTVIVDKYKVKEYLRDRIGEEYIIPHLGVWDNAEDIDFDALPDQFVLKCTHDSGGLVICKDKAHLDREQARKILNRSLRYDFYKIAREWPYKDVPRKIIAEAYISELGDGDLLDYKIYCFGGEPKLTVVCSERFTKGGPYMDFYDIDWHRIDIKFGHYKSAGTDFEKPKQYEKMLELCRILSKDMPFVRVDFYEVEGRLYIGEMTFFPGAGLVKISPVELDYKLGAWLHLETVHRS